MNANSGSYVGPYLLMEPIGAGGMGEVFKAKDPKLGRMVALKILPASFSNDLERLRRFEQEALTLATLGHPNIVQVFDAGTHEGRPYLIMELLTGETLRSRLRAGRLSTRRALEVAIPMANALAAAHEKGILHRDLKPENIFITQDGHLKLLDFGLAKSGPQISGETESTLAISEIQQVTKEGTLLGTVGYMSPEQVRGEILHTQSDIFAFGVVLYEMVTGVSPFLASNSVETLHAILHNDPPEPPVETNVPLPFQRIIGRCLEKAPTRRFESARDLAFALENLSFVSSSTSRQELPSVLPKRWNWHRLPWLFPVTIFAAALIIGAVLGHYSRPPRLTFKHPMGGNLDVIQARLLPGGDKLVVEARASRTEGRRLWTIGPEGLATPLGGTEDASLLDVLSDGNLLVALEALDQPGVLASVPVAGGRPVPFGPALIWHLPWDGKGRPWRMRVGLDESSKKIARIFEESMPSDPKLGEMDNWKVRHTIPITVLISGPSPRGQFRLDAHGEHIWWLEKEGSGATLVELDRQGVVSRQNLPAGIPFFGLSLASGPNGYLATLPSTVGVGTVLARVGRGGNFTSIAEFPEVLRIVDVSSDGRPVLLPVQSVGRVRWGTLGEDGERELALGAGESVKGLAPDGTALLLVTQGGTRIHFRREGEPQRLSNSYPLGLLGSHAGIATSLSSPEGPLLQVQALDARGEGTTVGTAWKALTYARPVPGRDQLIVGGLREGDESTGVRFSYLVSLKGGRVRRLPAGTIPVPDPDGAKALWLQQEGPKTTWGPLDLSSGQKSKWAFGFSDPSFRPLAWPKAMEVTGVVRLGPNAWEVRAVDLRSGNSKVVGQVKIPAAVQDFSDAVFHLSADGKHWAVSWSDRLPTQPFFVHGL